MSFLLYLLVGAVAGLLAGLLGIGGGLIIVPVLIITFQAMGFQPEVLTHLAVGSSLATVTATATASSWEHHRRGGVRWEIFLFLAAGIAVGSFLGAKTATHLQGPVLQMLIGAFAVAVGAKMLGLPGRRSETKPAVRGTALHRLPGGPAALAAAGGVIGWVAAMFGIGGGPLTVPYLTWRRLPARQAVGTSAACGMPIGLVGALTFICTGWQVDGLPDWSTGFVYWPAVLGIVLTSMVCARLGAKLAHKLPGQTLKRIFAVLLFVVGSKFLLSGFGLM